MFDINVAISNNFLSALPHWMNSKIPILQALLGDYYYYKRLQKKCFIQSKYHLWRFVKTRIVKWSTLCLRLKVVCCFFHNKKLLSIAYELKAYKIWFYESKVQFRWQLSKQEWLNGMNSMWIELNWIELNLFFIFHISHNRKNIYKENKRINTINSVVQS